MSAASPERGAAVGALLSWAHEALEPLSDTPALDAQVLLADALSWTRARLLAHPEAPLSPEQEAAFRGWIARRLQDEPVSYIRGRKEFYGLEFHVDRRALIPRPETELLVETCLEFARHKEPAPSAGSGQALTPSTSSVQGLSKGAVPLAIADVGAGSGAIAVALAVHLPHARVYALEYSAGALDVARRNARAHGVDDRVALLQGDLLDPLPAPVDIIAANLPYIRSDLIPTLARGIRDYEPLSALDGGPDGLSEIRRLVAAAPRCLNPHGGLFMEMADDQGDAVRALCRAAFPTALVEIRQDLAGRDRVAAVWT